MPMNLDRIRNSFRRKSKKRKIETEKPRTCVDTKKICLEGKFYKQCIFLFISKSMLNYKVHMHGAKIVLTVKRFC